MNDKEKLLRDIPSKDSLLNGPCIESLNERLSRQFLGNAIEETLEQIITAIYNGAATYRG